MFWGVAFLGRQVLAFARVFFLFLVALFLPKFFLVHLHSASSDVFNQRSSSFRLGLENISDSFLKKLGNSNNEKFKIGLITNQTGKDQAGTRTIDVLLKKGLNVSTIFAPEHGLEGDVAALRDIENGKDKKSNIHVISLYRNGSTKKFDAKILNNIDVLFFDMQDSGMRHYTFVTTLFEMLEAASKYGKIAVVLDRPNLLGPIMEGSMVDPSLRSAISYAPIPLRYGMTIGELAMYYNKKVIKNPAKLHVIQMKNYDRYSYRAEGLLAHLSPNITCINACYGYSFLGLLGEIRPFDLGVGTSRAFQCILLPESINFSKKKWHELHLLLKDVGVKNSFYRYYSPRKKQYCSGLRLSVENVNSFNSFSTLLMVVNFFKKNQIDISFSAHFDKAAGSCKVRQFLQGELQKDLFAKDINNELNVFFKNVLGSGCFLYRPFPKVVNLS